MQQQHSPAPPALAPLPRVLEAHGDEGSRENLHGKCEKSERKGAIHREGPTLLISELVSQNIKQQYIITPQLLLGTPISETKRAILRAWIYEEAARMRLERLVVATAGHLVDMFLSRGGVVEIQDFQALGIAALLLSNKSIANNITIRIDYRVFPLPLLNQLETRLCRVCNFRLRPPTHVHVLDELVALWNAFAQRHSDLWSYNCSEMVCEGGKGKLFDCRQVYELMDIVLLVVQNFNYSTIDLCLHAFRYFLMADYEVAHAMPKAIEDEVVIQFWCNPEDPLMNSSFQCIFTHFLSFLDENCPNSPLFASSLSSPSSAYDFLDLFLSNGFQKLVSRPGLPSSPFRQTFQPEGFKLCRPFFALKKNPRKGSGETMAV